MTKTNLAIVLILTGVVAVGAHHLAAEKAITPAASQPTATSKPLAPTPVDDKISPNDRLLVSVKDLVGMGVVSKLRTRVDPTGKISFAIDWAVAGGR